MDFGNGNAVVLKVERGSHNQFFFPSMKFLRFSRTVRRWLNNARGLVILWGIRSRRLALGSYERQFTPDFRPDP